jgi:toxin secretion/phage lysis holin
MRKLGTRTCRLRQVLLYAKKRKRGNEMNTIWHWIQAAVAAVGGVLGWYLGGFDGFLYALIAFVIADYVTGVLCAIVEKKLSSEIGAKGIAKKVAIFIIIGIAHLVDDYVLQTGAALRTAIIFFYMANECLSVLENSVGLGLPVPEKLREVLEQLRDKSRKGGGAK